jgi:FMN reductase
LPRPNGKEDTVRAVAISGSPRSPSKSRTLAELTLEVLRSAGCETQLIDVAMLPGEALLARASAPEIDKAIAQVGAAHIVVAASPTYRGLYTGAMKCLFDLMPPAHLLGKVCIPLQTGAAPQHFLTIEYGLRPLFASLDGVPIAGVYATDDHFIDGRPDDAVEGRVRTVAGMALALAQALSG